MIFSAPEQLRLLGEIAFAFMLNHSHGIMLGDDAFMMCTETPNKEYYCASIILNDYKTPNQLIWRKSNPL